MRPYDSRQIANWFVNRARRDGKPLTNMHLQKLVYFAHGWALGLLHTPLVREHVEAWEFGPVIPQLYRSLARWGSGPVTEPVAVSSPSLEPDEEELLEAVYNAYGGRTAYQLSALTHVKDTPWEKVYEPEQRGLTIPNSLIEQYFGERAAQVVN